MGVGGFDIVVGVVRCAVCGVLSCGVDVEL